MALGGFLRFVALVLLNPSGGVCQETHRALKTAELQGIHHRMDADGDSSVSMDEGLAYVKVHLKKEAVNGTMKILQKTDKDGDGYLSHHEFKAELEELKMDEDLKELLEGMFPDFDEDGSKLLDLDEAAILFSWMVRAKSFDRNLDGRVSFKEFYKVVWLKAPSEESKKENKAQARIIFKKLDLDGDKRLSPKEFYAYESGVFAGQETLRKLFEVADADSNQRLSIDELLAVREDPAFLGTSASHHIMKWIKDEGLADKDEL